MISLYPKQLLCVRIKWQPKDNVQQPSPWYNVQRLKTKTLIELLMPPFHRAHHPIFTCICAIKSTSLECTSVLPILPYCFAVCSVLCIHRFASSVRHFWSNHIYDINTFKIVVAEVNSSLLHNIKRVFTLFRIFCSVLNKVSEWEWECECVCMVKNWFYGCLHFSYINFFSWIARNSQLKTT